jgi:V8-like Glu-specific endopeptidase
MAAAEEVHGPLRVDSFDHLDSPFLTEEPVAALDRPGRRAPLGALEAESPFLGAIEPTNRGLVDREEEDTDRPCTGIIGHDDRVAVTRAWDIPYRWVCQISSRRRKGGKQLKFGPVGTGILISPRFVLTAAHLLRDSEKDEHNQWVDSETEYVVVTPARNDDAPAGNKTPFSQFEARGWRFSPGYNPRSTDAWKYDYAVIELKEPAGAKKAAVLSNNFLCFWGSRECGGNTNLEVLDPTQLAGQTAYTAGYPKDLGQGTRPYSTSGMLSGVDIRGRREIMNYDADGCPGQSGSPIWIERGGNRYLAGIFTKVGTGYDATTGLVSLNSAVRITKEVFDQISRWFEAVLENPWLSERESFEAERSGEWSPVTPGQEPQRLYERDSTVEGERGDDLEVLEFEDEQAEGQPVQYDTPVIVERDVPKTSTPVSVGQRVDLDLTKTAYGTDLDHVRWDIPGTVVRGYKGSASEATVVKLTPADLERPTISFFWVDAGNGRTVRAKIHHKSGAEEEFIAVYDVEGPTMDSFSAEVGQTHIEKEHGTFVMRFGNQSDEPGVNWTWKITMPPHHGGFVKDIQTVLADRSKVQRLTPGGVKTRALVWRHPSNATPHVQLDNEGATQPVYTQGLGENKIEAGQSFDTGRGIADSPRTGLASLDKTVSVNDRFVYYVMFKPDTREPKGADKPRVAGQPEDAIWVPVARATWSWKATADQRDKKWSPRKPPKMAPVFYKATAEFPVYPSNAFENEWQEAPPTSSHEHLDGGESGAGELEEAFGPDDESSETWTTEPALHDSGEEPYAYDTPRDYTLFERQVGGGGPVASWAAAIDPFPVTPTLAFHANEPAMVTAFASVTTSAVHHPCAALVDLTGNPTTPPYAGLNDDEMVFCGSMLKVCAMYAAFALRAQVQKFVDAAAANGAPVVPLAVTEEIEKAWKPKLQAAFPTLPSESFGNKQDITFPQLEKILTFLPDGRVDFARAAPVMTNARLDRAGEFGVPEGRFHDWMRLMMRWSNNTAASHCILALGYFYINAALAQAGFFDSATSNGLWVSADYAKHDWVRTLAEKNANAAGQPLTQRWATAQGRMRSNLTATAAQTARLLTLMAQDKLVDATASQEMRTLMQAAIECVPGAKCGIGSYVKDALDGARRAFTTLQAKKGFGDDSFSHECAIVERTVGDKHLRYVVVGLGAAKGRRRDLFSLFVRLDDAIVARNR